MSSLTAVILSTPEVEEERVEAHVAPAYHMDSDHAERSEPREFG